MTLRKGQKELVEQYRGGYCAVPAIPGGGKTYCLSVWASEIIAQGLHKPGKILIVTYMNSAVNNFKRRIAGELEKRGINGSKDYFVTTIHGLCLQIVKEKPDIAFIGEDFAVVDDVEREHLINEAVTEWRRKNEDRFAFYIDSSQMNESRKKDILDGKWFYGFCKVMFSAIGDFKCSGISPEAAIEKTADMDKYSLLKCAAEIYVIYDRKLKLNGFLDFNDMLFNAKWMLAADRQLLESYQKKYSFVCEDEAQDSNLIQSEILTMIANGNLLRVGDSNQAICGSFTSSDSTLFKSFCELPETKVHNITQSSRSTRDIINMANYFVKYVRENHPVQECRDSLLEQFIEPVPEDDERPNPVIEGFGINYGIYKSWDEEAQNIAEIARRMIKKHPELSSAVLIPTSWKMEQVADILEAKGVPFEQLNNTAGEKNRALKRLGSVLSFFSQPGSSERFSALIGECFLDKASKDLETGALRDSILEFLRECPVEKLLYPVNGDVEWDDIPEKIRDTDIWKDITGKFDFIRDILKFPAGELERLILFAADRLEFDREDMAIAHKIAGDVRYLVGQEHHWSLEDLAKELLKPRNVFSYFAGLVWELKGYEPKPGVLTLSTYHKAKGLEWDMVFLTGLTHDDFPVHLEDKFKGEYSYLKHEFRNPGALVRAEMKSIVEGRKQGDAVLQSKLENISEKARLLYVGITRAKKYLFLSGHHANPNRRNEILPSKYLLELKRYIEAEKEARNTGKSPACND